MAVIGQAEVLLTANTARFTTEMERARNTSRNTATDISRGFANIASESQRNASLVTRSFNQMTNVVNDLKNTLAGVVIGGGIVAGLDKIKTVSDAMKSLDTQVKLVTASEAEYLAVRQQVRGIADYVHNDINATTLLYTNSARALGNMGKSQQDVLKFTKAVSLAMAVGGKSANEQAAAILQLGQAMQSGVVQGDEFRSIAENAPVLLDLVAEKLGKTRGEVREMSKDGKITADVMYNALAGAIPKLEADYAKMPATMAGAWQVVKNKTAEGVGDFINQTGGISDTIANQMLGLANGIGATFDFIREHSEAIKGTINTAIGVGAVVAFTKLGESALATVPSLTASATAMARNAITATQNATSNARVASTLMAIVQGHTPAQMAVYRYTQAVIGATTATIAYVRNIPAMVAGLRATASSAMASARSMDVLALSKKAVANGAVLASRGVMGMGSALGSLGSLINRHPLMVLATVIGTVVIGTKGLQGAMQNLGDAVGVTGILFENFAKGAVEGIGFLAKDAVEFFNSFSNDSKKSTATADSAFGGLFKNTEGGFVGILQVSARVFDKIGSHIRATALYGVQLFGNMFTAVHNGFVHMGNGITSVFETIANVGVSSINFILSGVNKLIAGINALPANFGGGQAITPITLIADVKFQRGQTLAYDNTNYGSIYNKTQTTALGDAVDGAIRQQKAQTKATQQATGAMADLTKVTKAQATTAKDDEEKKSEKHKKTKETAHLLKNEEQAWARVMANAQKYHFAELEKQQGLPAGFLAAIHMQESRGNPNAVGPMTKYGKAKGGFQFIDSTWAKYGHGSVFDLANASPAAAKFLRELLSEFGSVEKAAAAYNAGPGNVKKYGGVPPFKETQGYVKGVARYMAVYNGGKYHDVTDKELAKGAMQAENEAQKQAENRLQIERQYADKLTQLKLDHDAKMIAISKAGFDDAKKTELLVKEQKDYENDVLAYTTAQEQKLASLTNFKKTEKQLVEEEYYYKGVAIATDKEMPNDQKTTALKALIEQRNLEYKRIDLAEAKEKQAANAVHQTKVENIQAEAQLQRDELDLDIKISAELRQAKLQAINDSEQEALRQARQDFENELSGITDYAQTEVQKLRNEFMQQRNALDARTDINDSQKSDLRNAMAGKFNHDLAIIRKPIADDFNNLNAEMSGTSEFLNLQNQLNQRLEIIKKAKDEEVIATEQAEQAKLAIQRDYMQASSQLITTQGENIAGSMTTMVKTMAGENSKAYRAMFAIEKGFAIARSIMAIQTGIAQAAANPFPFNIGAMASVAAATANIITTLQSVRQPAIQGQAHDGIDNIPREGTWLLDGGERIVKPRDNRKLTEFLDNPDKKLSKTPVNVNIINNAGVPVQQSQDSNGDIRVIIGEEIARQLPQHVNDDYSEFNQNLKRKYHIQRKL